MDAATTARWIAATLANDESSTDAELVVYFVAGGLTIEQATKAVALRDAVLKGGN